MSRYIYSLVRCVPDPATGEFVNVGAIAGNPDTGDWSVRQVSNERHVRKLAGATELGAVHGFLARVGIEIDSMQALMLNDSVDLLGEGWLQDLYYDHRNVVQLSPPTPIVADNAEDALDVLFGRQIIDPVTQARDRVVTKHGVIQRIRLAYGRADIDPHLVRRRVELFVGDRVHTTLDYAVANGTTVQLTQGWSFQGALVDAVSEQVKAWAYALSRLRDGMDSRIVGVDEWVSDVTSDVDLQVVVAPPRTGEQENVYKESEQIFEQLDASVHSLEDADAIGQRATELLDGNSGWSGLPYHRGQNPGSGSSKDPKDRL